MRCHFLLQGIFPTQGSNPGLARWTLGKSTTFQNKNTVFSKQKLYSLSYNNLEKNRRRMNRQLNHFAVKTKTVETRAVSLHLHVYNLPSWLHRAHTPPAHSPPLHTHLLHVLLHTHLLSSLLHTRLLYKLISCMFICTLVYSAHSSALSFTLISCTPFCTLASSARSSPAHSSPTGRRPQNPRSVLSTGQEGKAGDSGPAAVAGPGPLLSLHRAGASRVDGQ